MLGGWYMVMYPVYFCKYCQLNAVGVKIKTSKGCFLSFFKGYCDTKLSEFADNSKYLEGIC